MANIELVLPAIRGIQSGRQFLIFGCPIRLLADVFPDNDREPFLVRGKQHDMDGTRILEMTQYVTSHHNSYVFAPLTASIDSTVSFEPDAPADTMAATGHLRIPVAALEDKPSLGDESIGIVLFVDPGLKRSRQAWVDLKRHERTLPRSQLLLHDDSQGSGSQALRTRLRSLKVSSLFRFSTSPSTMRISP